MIENRSIIEFWNFYRISIKNSSYLIDSLFSNLDAQIIYWRFHRTLRNLIVELDSSYERCETLLQLCRIAYGGSSERPVIDGATGGVSSIYGRFSLKLRAQKPNPYFDATQPESANNKRYLEIEDENLRQRGLTDVFYKEYSYWIRNARICKRTVRMTLAQLLKIDMTVKVRIGDITGFIRKSQYTVSKKTGLGMVTFEIMYI